MQPATPNVKKIFKSAAKCNTFEEQKRSSSCNRNNARDSFSTVEFAGKNWRYAPYAKELERVRVYSRSGVGYVCKSVKVRKKQNSAVCQSIEGMCKQRFGANTRQELLLKMHELELYVNHLEGRVEELTNKKDILKNIGKNSKYRQGVTDIEDMYSSYSKASKKVIEIKHRINTLFENYINTCQEREKAVVDIKLEQSSQKTRMKLLQEALAKRNKEYSSALSKSEKIVSLLCDRIRNR